VIARSEPPVAPKDRIPSRLSRSFSGFHLQLPSNPIPLRIGRTDRERFPCGQCHALIMQLHVLLILPSRCVASVLGDRVVGIQLFDSPMTTQITFQSPILELQLLGVLLPLQSHWYL
jgi:hypothetical protein